MILRSSIERLLPVAEDEVRLSKDARQATFSTFYWFSRYRKIVGLEASVHHKRVVSHGYIRSGGTFILFKVLKQNNNGRQRDFVDSLRLTPEFDSEAEVLEEMSNPRALNRANRVERVARWVKTAFAVGAAVASAGLATGTIDLSGEPVDKSDIPQKEYVCDETVRMHLPLSLVSGNCGLTVPLPKLAPNYNSLPRASEPGN